MSAIKKILAAIAFSEYSQEIFDYAAGLAADLGAELIPVHVVNARDVAAVERVAAMGYAAVDRNDYVEGVLAEKRSKLTAIMAASPVTPARLPAERIRPIFKTGNPVDVLLRLTVAEEIDLVVMGIKGRTDLEHTLTGSVAEKIFRRCPVNVISYRDSKNAARLRKKIR